LTALGWKPAGREINDTPAEVAAHEKFLSHLSALDPDEIDLIRGRSRLAQMIRNKDSGAGDYAKELLTQNKVTPNELKNLTKGIGMRAFHSEVEQIAKRFFSAAEQEALGSLDKSARVPAFFRCWTRKEAYVKAVGTGLSLPLDQFDVSLLPGKPANLLATRPDPDEASRWILRNIEIEQAYAAAFVVERSPVFPQ